MTMERRPTISATATISRKVIASNNRRENEQRLISQLTLKRNSVLLQLRAAERASNQSGDLESTRRALERLARELERHLEAVNNAARRAGLQDANNAPPMPHSTFGTAEGRRWKRTVLGSTALAPSPLSAASSAPDLCPKHKSNGTTSNALAAPGRHRLRKSLSLTSPRGFFASVLASLRGNSRHALHGQHQHRRSSSHDSLDLSPIDLEQQLVRDTAVQAQQRRAAATRTGSPELRSQLTQAIHSDSEQLFIPSPKNPKHNRDCTSSIIAKRPPVSPVHKQSSPPTFETVYTVPGVSKEALYEIQAFEQFVDRFMSAPFSLQSSAMQSSQVIKTSDSNAI